VYRVDEHDRVIELAGVPQSSVGAPCPAVVATERQTQLMYFVEIRDPGWDGTSVRIVGYDSEETLAVVRFEDCYAHMFGPPNDEAFTGHPLSSRGLHPYGAFQVENSSWIRTLIRMNSVRPQHTPALFSKDKHYIFSFHDSTFECVAKGYKIELWKGSINSAMSHSIGRLGD